MRRIDEGKQLQAVDLYGQGLSLSRVAIELRISTGTVYNILVRHGIARRSLGEAISVGRTQYLKTNFSGDLAEKARIIGFSEDCGAAEHYRLTKVQTTSTHPAQIKYFCDTIGDYGHISKTPVYNAPFCLYQWHLTVLLNNSFRFIIDYKRNPIAFVAQVKRAGYEYEYIAGYADAESWVGIDANHGYTRTSLSITNSNRAVLEWMQEIIGGGIFPDGNCYQLQLTGKQSVEALRKLPLMHEEKVSAKQLILHHAENGGIGPTALWEYQALRRNIDEEVRLCKLQARLEWIRRHGRPHPKDPNQTIPENLTLSPSFLHLLLDRLAKTSNSRKKTTSRSSNGSAY